MNNELINEMFEKKMIIIYKYLVKLGCSKDNAEDIVQDTFYTALKYIDGIQTNKVSSWLFKVAINKYYDLCRKNNRHIYLSIDEEVFKERLVENNLVEEFILDLERKKEINEILNSISDVHKNLLFFKYDMGLSYKEIAELLGINENTVKTYLFRAREKFKKLWRDKYGYKE
ncbi:RNA polymerase sigma factor [Clostridium sp. ZBS15]|uniref:RNA polymerase sigma factor n=1 Tax=Clostridium sp. ZBS15 TaxID=2949969 RepID=UPI00207A0514|nr:RNA polymerase sigma factor [Clostridium sp. ZBS15]